MKALSSIMRKSLTLLLALTICFSAFACGKTNDASSDGSSGGDGPIVVTPSVTVTVEASKDTIKVGEEVTLTVTVENATDTSYTWSVDDAGKDIVQISDDVLTIKDEVELILDTFVVLTATSKEDTNAKGSKTIKVVAPVVEGRVGELTSDMIAALGNSSITVSGTLTDVYESKVFPALSDETVYDMTVEMEEGKWHGAWKAQETDSVIEDSYFKGEEDGVKDYNGNVGHPLMKKYINKYNEVAVSKVTDYMSVSAIWESQHLWNHIANLNVNEFTYDPASELYIYEVGQDETSLYLMTYLAISLTPMLEDTLVQIGFTVEDGAITSLIGTTQRQYVNLDEQTGEYDAYTETIIEVTFSNIGTTTVKDPTSYSAPEQVDVLKTALDGIRGATNYKYNTQDVTVSAPSGDSGDYELSVQSSGATTYKVPTANTNRGTVGTEGFVTEDKILLHETGKYDYGMDDNLYHHTWTGYKQIDENTFDYFEAVKGTLTGKRQYKGNIFDVMPAFDFSENVFEFAGSTLEKIGNKSVSVYKFTLRESSITREVAMEINLDGKDAEASVTNSLSIEVAQMGNEYVLYRTVIPYNLVAGTYIGYYSTVYSSIGTTTIPKEYFDGYVARTLPTTWGDTVTKYYQENFTGNSHEENTQTVIDATYGAAAKDLPSPTMIYELFGDSMSGPFYDWKDTGNVDSSGNAINVGWISIKLALDDSYLDENSRIVDFDALKAKIDAAMTANDYTPSLANTDVSGGESGRADRYLSYTKGNILVVISNNHTKWFDIDFYPAGAWSLNR